MPAFITHTHTQNKNIRQETTTARKRIKDNMQNVTCITSTIIQFIKKTPLPQVTLTITAPKVATTSKYPSIQETTKNNISMNSPIQGF